MKKKKETKKVAEIEREIRALPSKIIDPTPVNPNFIYKKKKRKPIKQPRLRESSLMIYIERDITLTFGLYLIINSYEDFKK